MGDETFTYDLRAPVIALWPALVKPKAYKDPKTGKEGPAKYGAWFLFKPEHPDIKPLKEKAIDALRAKWDDGQLDEFKWPWRTGEAAANRRKAKGKPAEFLREYALVIPARSKYMRLGLWQKGLCSELQTETEKMAAADKFYSGVEVVAQFTFKPFILETTEPMTRGVTAYVNMVASFARGKRLGGVSMAETFKNVTGHETQDDPTGDDDYTDQI